jgi:hypothetical protein
MGQQGKNDMRLGWFEAFAPLGSPIRPEKPIEVCPLQAFERGDKSITGYKVSVVEKQVVVETLGDYDTMFDAAHRAVKVNRAYCKQVVNELGFKSLTDVPPNCFDVLTRAFNAIAEGWQP